MRLLPGLSRICMGVALLWPGSFLLAQNTGAPVSTETKLSRPAGPDRHNEIFEERVKAFAKNLDLNADQTAAVRQILLDREQEMLRLRTGPSMTGSERIERIRMLQDETVMRIRAILNDEQRKKYDPLAVRKVQPAADQRSVEDWMKLSRAHDGKPPVSGNGNAH